MNKSILWLISLLFAASFAIVSCSESDGEENPYANWQERNQKYLDSIAAEAKANPGEWKVVRSYKLPPLGLNEQGKVNEYVYCKIINNGEGERPLFTDTVAVNYRHRQFVFPAEPAAFRHEGKLINGTVFDQSYKGELNPSIAVPVEFPVSDVIVGWTTALMNMTVGSRWELYIPSELAYEEAGSGSIPGYSTLFFDVDLVKLIPLASNGKSAESALDTE